MNTNRKNTFGKIMIAGASLGLCAAQASAVKIAEQGVAQANIVIATDATPAERHAAEELASFLGQVSKSKFHILNQAQAGKPSIFVGQKAAKTADAAFTTDGLGDDGIIIRTVGKDLILAGGEPRGTLYSVYTFLEDYVGCRWWTSTASTIPRKPTLAFENLNVRYVPRLESRETNYFDAGNGDFSVRNKFNGHNHKLFFDDGLHNQTEDLSRGGRKFRYIKSDRWGAHALSMLISPQVYFKEHPEWFSMINGKRTGEPFEHSSLCLTNAEMRQRAVDNTILAMWGSPNANIFALEQWDDGGPPNHCECPVCAAIEKEEGSAAGIMIRFTNDIMADYRKQSYRFEKGVPAISILAYHYTQKPPLHAKPDPEVIIRLCPIHADYSVPISDDRNREFRDDFEGWSKISNRLYIWYYSINFGYSMLPHPNMRVMGPNMRYLVDHSVKGVFAEAFTMPGGEMAEMRAWMLAKLMWNPNLDARQLMKEFTDGYYGPAGKYVLASLNETEDALAKSGEKLAIDVPPTAKYLAFDNLNKSLGYLKQAEAAVATDEVLRLRVLDAQLPIKYALLMNWDELQKQAKAANVPWPIQGTRKEAKKLFVADAVGRKGFPADYFLRMTID